MCEYCGCRQIGPLSELMDEHLALLDGLLDRHVRREEDGVFTALRGTSDFVDEVADLEKEHRDFETWLATLDQDADDFADRVEQILIDLARHVDREDLGIFPVSVVTLGADGWDLVTQVHEDQPSFLSSPH